MRLTLTLIILSTTLLSNAQQKLIYLDDNGKSVSEKKASTLEQHIKINDTLYEVNTYTVDGPRSTSIQYNDPKGESLNGRYITYDRKGNGSSVVLYSHGLKHGTAYFLTPTHRVLRTETYEKGRLIAKKDSTTLNAEAEKYRDSIKQLPNPPEEKESEFPGGIPGWSKYLNQTMRYPDHAVDKNIQGSAIVAFIVGKDGRIEQDNTYLETSAEYYLDTEALRIIRICPDWIPATQGGKQVRSWKKQPIIYKLEIQKKQPLTNATN